MTARLPANVRIPPARRILWGAALLLALAGNEMTAATVEDRAFVAACDGSQQKYMLVMPDEFAPDRPVTVLVALHGHGADRWQFVRQPRGECRAVRDIAARERALLVSPDYRAATSWMGPQAEADVVQIIHAIREQFPVARVILCGGSMGGTAALTFAALHPDLVDGVVALNGTANLVEYDRFLDAIAASYGGTKQQVPEQYRRRSAEFFPERFRMPLAATTGGADEVVPPDSALRLIESLRGKNPHVLSLHRPTGGHSTSYEDTVEALDFVFRATSAPSNQ